MGRIRDRGNDGGNVYRWQTLARFVNTNGWRRGAELGVHDGVNYKYLINNCPNLHLIGVDLYEPQPENNGPEKWTPGEHGHAWNHNAYYDDMREFSIKHPDRTDIIKDYTTEAAKTVYDGSLDFVYIDGDHSYDSCKEDINMWLPKIKQGGIIAGHDYLEACFMGVVNAVNETFGKPDKTYNDTSWLKFL